jgi:REP element-mobilizing transposase RayT
LRDIYHLNLASPKYTNIISCVSHTYFSGLVHCVFSTKERRNLISQELQPKLWAYLGGIARKNGMRALAIGGTENHVHVLLSLSPTMPVAKAVQLLKGGSSKWLHESGVKLFAWQEVYGAFTVGTSHMRQTITYIAQQRQHHAKRPFEAEFIAFLRKHGIEYDAKYIWG